MIKKKQKKPSQWRNKVTIAPIKAYFKDHQRVIQLTLQRLLASPVNTLMTCMVIAIALSLPVSFYLLLENVQSLSPRFQGDTQISLFLKKDQTDKQSQLLANELRQWPEITSINVISKQQALEEFQQLTGVVNVLEHLPQNPLPVVLEISPADTINNIDSSKALLARLQNLKAVDIAQLDLAWVQRLSAIIAIGQRLALALIILLSTGVLLVIGNTIRLEIESRRKEIEVAQLVGATEAFVRRPFLYTGIGYGLFGGILSLLVISLLLWSLSDPIAELSGLYHIDYQLLSLSFADITYILMLSALLGFAGAWFSVNRHLEQVQPG